MTPAEIIVFFFSNVCLVLKKAIFPFALKIVFPAKVRGSVSLCIRKGGIVDIRRASLRDGVRFFADGGKVVLSDGVFVNCSCSFNSMSEIFVDENTLLGEAVMIYDHDHAFLVI